jgi:DNA-binding PadR family transcriptional regulator
MSLKHGLLGFLSYGPKTGYDLSKMFFEPLRPSLSQIYRKLNLLAEEGLVECERVDQEKLPNKNVFTITDKGMDELKKWLKEPPEFVVPRETLLTKLWYGSRVSKKDMVTDIKKYSKKLRVEVDKYKTMVKPAIKSDLWGSADPLDRFYWTLVVDRTIAQYEALLEWTDHAVKLISSFDESGDARKRR